MDSWLCRSEGSSRNMLVGLAPMEGVSDFPFRLWMYMASAPDYLSTPFLRVTDTFPGPNIPEKFCPELFDPDLAGCIPYHTVPQLMAVRTADFLRVAEIMLRSTDFVDLNCGCPSPTVVGKGAGSSMLIEPEWFARFIETLTKNLGAASLSVKIRTGFASAARFPELIAALASQPLRRLTVHGRSRFDGYTGKARLDLIAYAAEELHFPVVGSGDITDRSTFQAAFRRCQPIAGFIIGRGALRNPWIFKEIRENCAVELEFSCLRDALACFGLLHHLYETDYSRLKSMLMTGIFRQQLGTDRFAWAELRQHLAEQAGTEHARPAISKWAMGRTKLLWHYLRCSLPPAFFAPHVFRVNQLAEFLTHIEALQANSAITATSCMQLQYAAQHDWLYAGKRRQD